MCQLNDTGVTSATTPDDRPAAMPVGAIIAATMLPAPGHSQSEFARFIRDTDGQDLVEYALLAVTVGLAMTVSVNFVLSIMGTSYSQTMTNVGDQWQTPNPGGS